MNWVTTVHDPGYTRITNKQESTGLDDGDLSGEVWRIICVSLCGKVHEVGPDSAPKTMYCRLGQSVIVREYMQISFGRDRNAQIFETGPNPGQVRGSGENVPGSMLTLFFHRIGKSIELQ